LAKAGTVAWYAGSNIDFEPVVADILISISDTNVPDHKPPNVSWMDKTRLQTAAIMQPQFRNRSSDSPDFASSC
jgi:hypothetical protein